MKLAIVFSSYGPYHLARLAGARAHGARLGHETEAVALTASSRIYQWQVERSVPVTVLCGKGQDADVSLIEAVVSWVKYLRRAKPNVVALAGYWPLAFALLAVTARLCGVRCVLMNESHAGTADRSLPKRMLKRALLRLFDSAVLGGRPHVRHFASLGMASDTLHTGYDCVDNDYFREAAGRVRDSAAEYRAKYALPEAYFVNIGRFVEKKNLGMLVEAYAALRQSTPALRQQLVLVGDGEEAAALREKCARLQLPVVEHGSGERIVSAAPAVHFYGFRQIDETPVFYALADGFILPSLREEWGLVVNEAMACSIPVVVSEAAGCAPDLLPAAGEARNPRQNGFIFDPRSAEELAAALAALAADPQLRKSMGEASLRVVGRFSCENFGAAVWAAALGSGGS